jgi:hypothetical protein
LPAPLRVSVPLPVLLMPSGHWLGGSLIPAVMVVLPLPADADFYSMPLAPMQPLRELSAANVYRAAWHHA